MSLRAFTVERTHVRVSTHVKVNTHVRVKAASITIKALLTLY